MPVVERAFNSIKLSGQKLPKLSLAYNHQTSFFIKHSVMTWTPFTEFLQAPFTDKMGFYHFPDENVKQTGKLVSA